MLLPRVLGVVGAGQMGAGIAQVAAVAGLDVLLMDTSRRALERAQGAITGSLHRAVEMERLTEEQAQAALARIQPQDYLETLCDVDFVIEAVRESEDIKRSIFARLDKIVQPDAILATNTSSISITRIGAATSRPHAVVGMHFMNPVPRMKLVEIIRGMATSDQTHETTRALAAHFGKTVSVSIDRPGFIINRLLMPMINEAFFTLMEGVATAEDIDRAMKQGTNHPMGPLAVADLIGLDTCVAIMRVLHGGFGDSKYRPCPLLVQYVDAGWWGKKVGKGVYEYPGWEPPHQRQPDEG